MMLLVEYNEEKTEWRANPYARIGSGGFQIKLFEDGWKPIVLIDENELNDDFDLRTLFRRAAKHHYTYQSAFEAVNRHIAYKRTNFKSLV